MKPSRALWVLWSEVLSMRLVGLDRKDVDADANRYPQERHAEGR